MKQQAGTGLGICGSGQGWSGGATRSSQAASRSTKFNEGRPQIFFEICFEEKQIGRIVFELWGELVPKTVENFRQLVTGEHGETSKGKKMHYKGTKFHRIVPGFCIQGGDFESGDGKGGESIYGKSFLDENFQGRHDKPGILSMANKGPDTNNSQFFVTTQKQPRLDGRHVAFGEVISGMDVLLKCESAGQASGVPVFDVVISDCGELESAARKKRDRGEVPALPKGWERRESRTKKGFFYYYNKLTQKSQVEVPLENQVNNKLQKLYENQSASSGSKEPAKMEEASNRACREGEVRLMVMLRKHRSFNGKPQTSWRQKEITVTKDEAKEHMKRLRIKLCNAKEGGGIEMCRRKWENLARLESDADCAQKGSVVGPWTKSQVKVQGMHEALKGLTVGDISPIFETKDSICMIMRIE